MTFPHLSQITSAVALALFLAAGSLAQSAAEIAGCPAFPADNILNTPVDDLPVHARSDAYVASIGTTTTLHADFGSGLYEGGTIGIPWTSVPGTQPKVPVSFLYDDESEPGPYPIPPDAPVEGGSDDHVLVVERDGCVLYEVFDAERQSNGSWRGGSGAVFDLRSNRLRPDTWTSADAAGLPIAPLLVRYEEVAAGEIRHAIRFTADRSQRAYVWPGRHFASDITDPNVPPMAQRFRLKAGFDVTRFSPPVRVILTAMKKYGLILADNGSDWYINGAPDEHWDNDVLRELRQVRGSDFEAVDVSSLMSDPNSGQARARGAAAAAVVHAASLQAGPVSPGLIVSIFGSGLGTADGAGLQLDTTGRVATTLAGTRVLFSGYAAPLTFARQDQVNAIVPYAIAGSGSATLEVEYEGHKSAPVEMTVLDATPALFTAAASGTGQAAVLNQDFSLNSATNPAEKGSVVMLYATGEGQTEPAVIDGEIAPSTSWAPQLQVGVRIGGELASVEYAGAAPGLVAGVMQINARVPQALLVSGDVPVAVMVGTRSSPAGVTVAVR